MAPAKSSLKVTLKKIQSFMDLKETLEYNRPTSTFMTLPWVQSHRVQNKQHAVHRHKQQTARGASTQTQPQTAQSQHLTVQSSSSGTVLFAATASNNTCMRYYKQKKPFEKGRVR
jgi:hypothetical protein